MEQPILRANLARNVTLLKSEMRRMGLAIDDSPVPIICLCLASAARMQRIQNDLMHQGILIAYFHVYSGIGPEGALRIAVFANHTEEMLRQLLDGLRRAL
jgi:7-keto-8-aminopelargonate synthetase-like enzyme